MLLIKVNRMIALVYLILQIHQVRSQVINIDWEHALAGSGAEQAYDIVITPDSNILIVGYASPLAGVFTDCGENGGFVAVKLDTLGNIIWNRCYGGSEGAQANAVINTGDGGYLIAGYTFSSDGDVTGAHGNADCWVVKLDAVGNLEWEQAYGGTDEDVANDIIELNDIGYAVVSLTSSIDGDIIGHHGADTNYDAWIKVISTTGDIIWSKCFGGSGDDAGYGIVQDSDGNLVITGYSFSSDGDVPENKGITDVWVFKVDLSGELIWSHTYGGSQEDEGNKIKTIEDSYYVVGETYSDDLDVIGNDGGRDAWLLKLDVDGNLILQKSLGGSHAEEFNTIEFVDSNEIVLSGISTSANGDLTNHYGPNFYTDHWVVSTDTLGNINWQKSLGGSLRDEGWGMVKLSSSTYVTTGFTYSSDYDVTENAGYSDIWTVKLSVCNTVFYADADGDGFGDPIIDSVACAAPAGFVIDSTDCNDADNTIFAAALDICNGMDDNCNGLIDEDAVFVSYYADADMDGYGDAVVDSVSCSAIADFVTNNLDCNDLNAEISPDAPELCNAIDDNCNGIVDDGLIIYTLYVDADSDGFGTPLAALDTCLEFITGFVSNGLDCNDTLSAVYPGAEEICNELDDDCDGLIDDNLVYTRQYEDADGDVYGNIANDTLACSEIPGYVTDSTDCNDNNPNIYPGAIELLNGLDDDCDGISDEGLEVFESSLLKISIYPNPNLGSFILTHPACASATYSILDITGRPIKIGKCTAVKTQIELPHIATGMYTCKWSCTSGSQEYIQVVNFVVSVE